MRKYSEEKKKHATGEGIVAADSEVTQFSNNVSAVLAPSTAAAARIEEQVLKRGTGSGSVYNSQVLQTATTNQP